MTLEWRLIVTSLMRVLLDASCPAQTSDLPRCGRCKEMAQARLSSIVRALPRPASPSQLRSPPQRRRDYDGAGSSRAEEGNRAGRRHATPTRFVSTLRALVGRKELTWPLPRVCRDLAGLAHRYPRRERPHDAWVPPQHALHARPFLSPT